MYGSFHRIAASRDEIKKEKDLRPVFDRRMSDMAAFEQSSVRYKCPYEYCGKEEIRLEHIEAHIAAVHLHYMPYLCGRAGCGVRKPTAHALCEHYEQNHHSGDDQNGGVVAHFRADQVKQNDLYRAIDRCLSNVQEGLRNSTRAVSPPVMTPDQGSDIAAPAADINSPPEAEQQPPIPSSDCKQSASVGRRTMSKISAKNHPHSSSGCHGAGPSVSSLDSALNKLYQMANNLPPSSAIDDRSALDALSQHDSDVTFHQSIVNPEIHDDNFKFHCSKCGKRFVESRSFWNHWKRHRIMAKRSADRPFKCELCPPPGQWFATDRALSCHKHVTHRKRFERQCDLCKRVFVSRAAYNTHCKEQHGFVPYDCEKCGKRFHNSGSLRSHEVQHELSSTPSADRTHACKFCNEFFKTNRGLSNHIVRAHGNKYEQQCPHCDKVYVSRASFSAHLSAAHNIAQYMCSKCGKDNRSERELRTHQQRWCTGVGKVEPADNDTPVDDNDEIDGEAKSHSDSNDSDDVPLAKVAKGGNFDKESPSTYVPDMDLDSSMDEGDRRAARRSTTGGMQLRKVLSQTKRFEPAAGEGPEKGSGRQKRSSSTFPCISIKDITASMSKEDPCTYACVQCKTQVPGSGVCEHIVRVHMRRPLVRCPVPNCLFADQFDMTVVLRHLRATHAKPYCDMQPVDDRLECQSEFEQLVSELFPNYKPRDFQTELRLDKPPLNAPISSYKVSKRETPTMGREAEPNSDMGAVCMPCGKWVANRAQTTHVYMEMFKYDASLGRFKCTRCSRRSSGRGALVSHFAVSHRLVPTGESIRDCADELIHSFQEWWRRCFGAPPPM